MFITVQQERDGDWLVLAGLEQGDPLNLRQSFVIGCGATRDAAIARAVKDLEEAVEELQAPAVPGRER